MQIIRSALFAAASLAACGSPDRATDQPATLSQIVPGELEVGVMFGEGAPLFDLVKTVGDGLEQDFPGTEVTYTFNNTAARPAIETRMLAGDPLDVDFIFEGMDPRTHDWIDGGYIVDLTEVMRATRTDSTAWQDDFLPLFRPSMQYNGKIYGAPEQVVIHLLHYNKGLLDEWGLAPPRTWEELLRLCEVIQAKGVAPIAVSGQVNFYVGMWFDHLSQQLVGADAVAEYLYGDSDASLFDDPGFLEAAQRMDELRRRGFLIEGWEGTDFTTTQLYFFQRRAVMILMGSWLMTEMKASIPPGFELAVAPFPKVRGGVAEPAIFGRVLSWSIPTRTRVPGLALEFLRRITSRAASAERARVLGAISPVRGVPAPPEVNGIEAVLQDAESAEFILYNYGTISARFGLAAAWYDPLVAMWLGRLTPREALSAIDENLTAVRAQRATTAR